MKYIRLKRFGFILFQDTLKHSNVAADYHMEEVVSAGFVYLSDDGPFCTGRSDSLGVESKEGDTPLLRQQFEY